MLKTKTRTKATKAPHATRSIPGPVEIVGPARSMTAEQRDAIDRSAAAAAELVELLQANGVTFAAPELAPSQIASSILAAWKLAADGPRDSDADFLIAVSGAIDGLAHALASRAPCAPLAMSILAPAGATNSPKGRRVTR